MIAQYALYRYWDIGDRLLYVGKSGDVGTRHDAHIRRSQWMQFAARSAIEKYDSPEELADAERAAIKDGHPVFNRIHNDTPEARERLRAYLEEAGRPDLIPARVKPAGQAVPGAAAAKKTVMTTEALAAALLGLRSLPPLDRARTARALTEKAMDVLGAETASGVADAMAGGMTQAAAARALGTSGAHLSALMAEHGLGAGRRGRPKKVPSGPPAAPREKRYGGPRKGAGGRFEAAEVDIAEIARLREAGMSWRAVGAELGISYELARSKYVPSGRSAQIA